MTAVPLLRGGQILAHHRSGVPTSFDPSRPERDGVNLVRFAMGRAMPRSSTG
jgi:hypothetical protein